MPPDGKAAKWADTKTDIQEIINKSIPTQNGVAYLREALCRQFPGFADEDTGVSVEVEIATLRQEKGETLTDYHQRAPDLLRRAGGEEITNNGNTSTNAIQHCLKKVTHWHHYVGQQKKQTQPCS